MKILPNECYPEFLDYVHRLKASLPEWLLVNVVLAPDSDADLTIANVAGLLNSGLSDHEGVLYVCSATDLLLIIRWGSTPRAMMECGAEIARHLPENACQTNVEKPTPEGLRKLAVSVNYRKPEIAQSLIEQRRARTKNVFLVVDDDAFQRILIKKGLGDMGQIVEIEDGAQVMTMYKQVNPDVVFLDIHLPNQSGRDILHHISMYDPDAFVAMISADATQENIADTWQKGAQTFITKPFTKDRLIQCVRECPTVHLK